MMDPIHAISVENAPLGRLVWSRRRPHQDYHDPFIASEAVVSEVKGVSFDGYSRTLSSSSFSAKVTQFALSVFSNKTHKDMAISTAAVDRRSLNNSTEWFERACENPETQYWVQKAIRRSHVYLIVGHFIVTDATLASTRNRETATSADARIPVPSLAGDALDVKLGASHESGCEQRVNVQYPGQVVCAVEYRKLKTSWFSSRDRDSLKLEKRTGWVVSGAFRDGSAGVDTKDFLVVDLATDDDESTESEDEDSDDE